MVTSSSERYSRLEALVASPTVQPRELGYQFYETFARSAGARPNPREVPASIAQYWRQNREVILASMPTRVMAEVAEVMDRASPNDPAIETISLGVDEQVTFVVGAGASAPAPSSIPTVSKLLSELWVRAERIDQPALNQLREWCEANHIANIEDLLTAAYIADLTVQQDSLPELLQFFLFGGAATPDDGRRQAPRRTNPAAVSQIHGTLSSLFGLLMGLMIDAPPNPAHEAIAALAKRHQRTSIVTTNYDSCVDAALVAHKVPYRYGVEAWPSSTPSGGVELIKVHGSVNWSYCDSCQQVRVFDLKNVRDTFSDDLLSYPVVGICKRCQGQRQPMIVPPLAVKLPIYAPLFSLWESARAAFEQSDLVIAVGYSFADADSYLTRMLELATQERPNLKIVVVDTDARIARKLRTRLRAHVQGFTDDRVLAAAESCEVFLPKFVNQIAPLVRAARSTREKPIPTSKPAARKVRAR